MPSPAASRCVMTELVLPNDTNVLGNLMGGRLLHQMDICAAITAQRHSQHVCVTASVDNVEFQSPIRMGEVVVLESHVNRAFRTSLEVEINVWAENPIQRTRRKCNRAFFTFVAMDEDARPALVPPLEPESDEERLRFDAALRRRELRLLMAGRIQIQDAEHITALVMQAHEATHRADASSRPEAGADPTR